MNHDHPAPNDPDLGHHDPDQSSDAPGLDHLHPDRIRIGSVGVFAGDWAWTPTADGAMRIPVGFVSTLIDRWNGWAVFACTRTVAEAIVTDQQQQRDQFRQTLAETGVPARELDARVNESMAALWWDGDTIVADQRGMYDDPEAFERIGPDEDGRYVVMGRNWCWEAVHPNDCDRIVGDLPTPDTQQEFVRLTHTPGLRLPHDRLAVRVDREWLTTNGPAFVGALTLDGLPVAAIRDCGDGNGTRLDDRGGTWPGLAEYLSGCRLRGAPAALQRLLDALVDEHRVATAIADAPGGVSVVRLVDDEGRSRILGAAPTPHDRASHEHLARHLTDDFHGSSWAGEWQLRRGHGWTHLTRVGDPTPASTPDQPTTGPA